MVITILKWHSINVTVKLHAVFVLPYTAKISIFNVLSYHMKSNILNSAKINY